MNKTLLYILLGIFGFGVFILILQEVFRDKDYNWSPSYRSTVKEPYGSEILYKRIPDLFPDQEVKMLSRKFFLKYDSIVFEWQDYENGYFDYDEAYYYEEDTDSYKEEVRTRRNDQEEKEFEEEHFAEETTYSDENESLGRPSYVVPFLQSHDTANIFIVTTNLGLTDFDQKSLFMHVYQGNHAFIAMSNFNHFSDILNLKTELIVKDSIFNFYAVSPDSVSDYITMDYSIHKENDQTTFSISPKHQFTHHLYGSYFDSIPTNAEVIVKNNLDEPVLIKMPYGKGYFYLCSTPILFTNYYMLKPHHKLISELITMMPNRTTYWGNDYYNYRDPNRAEQGLLQFIHKIPGLKWAYYTLLFTFIAFLVLELRRKQNAIPIIKSPKNSTMEFIGTISQLYLTNKDHKIISDKKIQYFLEYLRTTYKVKTAKFNDEFYFLLSEKTGYSDSKLKQMFYTIRQYKHQEIINKDQLFKLNKYIYKFKSGTL